MSIIAMKQALEALETGTQHGVAIDRLRRAILEAEKQEPVAHQDWCASLTQMLTSYPPKPAPCNCTPTAAPVQEPVVGPSGSDWVHVGDGFYRKRGDTAPPQRQPLTDEEILALFDAHDDKLMFHFREFARAIERAHGIGGEHD